MCLQQTSRKIFVNWYTFPQIPTKTNTQIDTSPHKNKCIILLSIYKWFSFFSVFFSLSLHYIRFCMYKRGIWFRFYNLTRWSQKDKNVDVTNIFCPFSHAISASFKEDRYTKKVSRRHTCSSWWQHSWLMTSHKESSTPRHHCVALPKRTTL